MQSSLSDGKTPLWLNANKHGLSSLSASNGYFRASAIRPLADDFAESRFDIAYGLDLAAAYNYTSSMVVQQAFVEGRWLKGVLTVGSKEWQMELMNNSLSSGAQTFGINARPVPQVRVALADWWRLPVLSDWLQIKGHLSYGMLTDEGWQKEFTGKKSKYSENVLYQSKSGYLRIANEQSPLTVTLGIETASLFGGKSYVAGASGLEYIIKNSSSLNSFWHAFWPGGADAQDNKYPNIEGDVLGSWVVRVDYSTDKWTTSLYADHFFEDHSAMFLMDYNGYGQSEEWDVKKKSKYLLYGLKDIMLGFEWKQKRNSFMDNLVVEYIYTKYQSGPIYHDHTAALSDHIGGQDDYYNHGIWEGWQHWGQVMGNPLYLSPLYNDDGMIEVRNNRFVAYHIAFGGHPAKNLSYRLKATWQDALGTYNKPYDGYKHSLNLMADATWHCAGKLLDGWWTTLSVGMDRGNVHGNNFGAQLTIGKTIHCNTNRK